jgi:hypothetical protein
MEVFNRVYNHKIWNTVEELHKGTKDVREQKYLLVKEAFNSFKMIPNELANDMYSHLNVIVNELSEIGLTKLSDEDISRKIIQVLPKDRYSTIVTYFHLFEKLRKMKPTQVLSKIIAHDLSMKIDKEPSPSSQDVGTSSKTRRRRLKINKNLPHQVRKLKSNNQAQVQAQVKPQAQVRMRVVMMERRKMMMIKKIVVPRMIVKKSSNLLKKSTSYSRSLTQKVSLQAQNNWSYNQ